MGNVGGGKRYWQGLVLFIMSLIEISDSLNSVNVVV